jgi:hypothetical protein
VLCCSQSLLAPYSSLVGRPWSVFENAELQIDVWAWYAKAEDRDDFLADC